MNGFFHNKPAIPVSTTIEHDGTPIVVTVRINARARGYRLSLQHRGGPVLTLPPYGSWTQAEAFLLRHITWLMERLDSTPKGQEFSPGSMVPLRGEKHRVVAADKLRGQVEVTEENGEKLLLVPGTPEHQARRLIDWLKSQARIDLMQQTRFHAMRLNVVVRAVKLRDQKSRWGSCSSTGTINYNWRLIMAPSFVLDYVAAHEVAHLVEMNHSPAFWATVRHTLPDMEKGRAWLKMHGRQLIAK